jgi:hypothetical protein
MAPYVYDFTMTLLGRQQYDVNALLSPGFAKTIESNECTPDPVAIPIDIFKVNVNDYFADFGSALTSPTPGNPLSEITNGTRSSGVSLGRKPDPPVTSQPARPPPGQTVVASRFGYKKT